jgi:ParB family transcriptional regulator, chromosome partitioning protein
VAQPAEISRPVHRVKVGDVKIRVKRQRSELGDLEGLAESILRIGQLTPIIITRNDELIAGERRLEAFKLNGMVLIEALYSDEVDPIMLEEMELEENIRRKQLTWQEEQHAIARIHKLRQMQDPNWGQRQTAEAIMKPGQNPMNVQSQVSVAISLEKMMALFPEIAKAKNVSQAMNMAKAKAKQVTKIIDVQARPLVYQEVQEKIWLGDSVKLVKDIEDEAFDMVLTDPPFGVNYDAQVVGSVRETDVYKDTVEKYEYILTIAPDLYRITKKDGWCVWFFGMTWYERVKEVFRSAGFVVDEIPIMWDRSDGRTFTNVPNHYFTKGYDVALHCFKGDPILVRKNLPNVIRVPPVATADRDLTVERPVELYKEILSRCLIKGQSMLDPFVGSGSSTAAAAELGIEYTAIEIDEARRANAIQKTRAHIPAK